MRCRGSHGLADPAYQSRSLLWLATRCTVLRSRWCQKQVDSASPSPLQVSLVRQSLRGGSARAFVRVTTVLRVSLPPSWRPQRARRPGRSRSCVNLRSWSVPLPSSTGLPDGDGATSLEVASPTNPYSPPALFGG